MKLLKAHITNFGKLHNLDIDFNDGLNTFIHENGWGKTTLSVFIKAMFYGLEFTTSTRLEKNERLKYHPWQGGIFGGSLSFSYKGKPYLVARTFGTKKNDDTFELRDLQTNRPSSDFSENLGNELFGINRETYGRSVHVTLDETPVGSTDISARLNNLLEAADVANFDDAISTLEKKATAIKAKRGSGGELNAIQGMIDKDRDDLAEIRSRLLQSEEYEKKIAALQGEVATLKKQQDFLTEQLSASAKYETKLRYEQLQNDIKSAQDAMASLLDFFGGKLPAPQDIATLDGISRDYTTVSANLQNQSATQGEKDDYENLKASFAGDVPGAQQIENCIKTNAEFQRFRQEESEKKLTPSEQQDFDALGSRFSGSEISQEKIEKTLSDLADVQNAKAEVSKLEADLQAKSAEQAAAKEKRPKNVKRAIFITGAVLFMLEGAAAFMFALPLPVGIAAFAVSIAAWVFGVLSKGEQADTTELDKQADDIKQALENLRARTAEKERSCNAFIATFAPAGTSSEGSQLIILNKIGVEFSRYDVLAKKHSDYEAWLKNQPKTPDEYETELRTFLKRFCKTDDLGAAASEIQVLNERIMRLSELEKKINADAENARLKAQQKERLIAMLAAYKTRKNAPFEQQVQEVHDRLNDVKNTDNLMEENSRKLREFEDNPEIDVASFASLQKPSLPAESLRAELSGVTAQINDRNASIADYQKIINDNQTFTDKKEDIETEIDRLSMEKQEKSAEHAMLLKTQELLSRAKENLDANYSAPMKEGFAKYVRMIGGKLNLVIDTELTVSVDDEGKLHSSDFLSEGYKDMVNFCSRMALIDALFTETKPPVILDDPFVNLDDEKVPLALSLVRALAQEKQVLYFACHNSRRV